jgi:RND superfamily putative drug exporter
VRLRRSRGRREPAPENDDARASWLLRHPRGVLAVFAVFATVLAVLGFQVQDKLSPTSLDIEGTPSYEANQVLRGHFGDTALFGILLRGPADEIDRQGPQLVRALRAANPAVTTLSPWDEGSVDRLRAGPREAMILADFHVPIAEAVNESVDELDEILEREVQPPVTATQSGFPTLSRALQEESIAASERAELIALPILLIVLLLVFRTPVAAGIPLVFGAITVFTSTGVLTVVTDWVSVDAFAFTVCTMMGLALGVDYALLMVSRFREELLNGAEPFEAAVTTRRTAGRTVIFAGSTLFASMVVAYLVVPGALLASLAATVMLVVAISVFVAVVAGPAVLTILGSNVNRWRIGALPSTAAESSTLMTLVGAALRRPALVCLLVGGIVLAFSVPALGLKTGPPSAEQLASDNQARQDAELINRTITPGFDAPFLVVAESKDGPITDPDRLDALRRWQEQIAAQPGVQLVIGPQQISKRVAPLRETGNSLLAEDGGPVADLARLGRNLGRAAVGVRELRGGISEATNGAGLLAQGSDGAEEGATRLAAGLARATSGSEEAVDALGEFAKGSRQLADGLKRAREGSQALKIGLHDNESNFRNNGLRLSRKVKKGITEEARGTVPELQAAAQQTDEQVQAALQQLEGMTTGKADPKYGPTLDALRKAAAGSSALPPELEGVATRLQRTADFASEATGWWLTGIEQMKTLGGIADELDDGLIRLGAGGNELADGSARLADASKELSDGLERLGAGATRLAQGIAELGDGASSLQVGLSDAFHQSYPLQTGLRRATVRVTTSANQARRQTDQLRRSSPGIFDSGYFVLSAVDGAPPKQRRRAGQTVDLEHGGQAATMFVFTRYTFNSQGSIDFNKRLEKDTAELASETGLNTGVAGGAATLNDYSRVTRERIPTIIVVITLATFLIMVVILRALLLAALAVLLNLATVAVAFGVLTLLFDVPDSWPIGGQSYIDVVGGVMMFGIIFGLSIDYAVFLLIRMRERYEVDGDNPAAIEFGLEKTARVITGAAAIMIGVFVAFAAAPIANVSQLGIGLTIAVLLDATVVRIVFLPALMLLLGDRVWWMPRPLERLIPKFDV